MHQADRIAAALARDQRGTFARWQLVDRGVSTSAVDRRVASGTWSTLDHAVYALPSHPRTWHQQVMAATLGRRGAVASGWTAAALWGIGDVPPRGAVEVTVGLADHHRSRLARVRRSSRREPRTQLGISVTSPPLTLVDLAGRADDGHLGRMLDDALRLGLCRTDHVGAWVVRLAGSRHAGIGRLRGLLAERGEGFVVPESALEHTLFEVMVGPGIPRLVRQARFPWRPDLPNRVDGLADGVPLIVEADGRAWHARFEQMAADRERDRLALRHGYLTLRFTHLDLTEAPEAARDDVRATIAQWWPDAAARLALDGARGR